MSQRSGCLGLFLWNGTIARGPYTLIGVLGFAIKHNLDRFVAHTFFDRPWNIFNYLAPLEEAVRIASLSREDAGFLATMVALALPFIWVGVVLTIRRLRDVGLPGWLVAAFFLPAVNLLFFLILSLLPSRDADLPSPPFRRSWVAAALARLIPDHPTGSAAMAILITIPFGSGVTYLGVSALDSYGLGLFVGIPFFVGLISVLVYGYHRPRSLGQCLGVSTLTVTLLGALLLALAVEGLVCLVMAAPLALVVALFGAIIGYAIQNRPALSNDFPSIVAIIGIGLPLMMGAERAAGPDPVLFEVRTSVEVSASPEEVWRNVVDFPDLPEPKDWIFRIGIAYPMRAEIQGRGAGAVRRCVFSTGDFIEPIEVWDEPRRLKFSVTQNPPPMQEWTPYRRIHPSHLEGFLVSESGQFLLEPIEGGGTRLTGVTWYRHGMWPAAYWKVWSDFIMHRIHLRVLRHIQSRSEGP